MTGNIQATRTIGQKVDKVPNLLTLMNKEWKTTNKPLSKQILGKNEYRNVVNLYRKMEWLEVSVIAKVIGLLPWESGLRVSYILSLWQNTWWNALRGKGLFYHTVSANFLHYGREDTAIGRATWWCTRKQKASRLEPAAVCPDSSAYLYLGLPPKDSVPPEWKHRCRLSNKYGSLQGTFPIQTIIFREIFLSWCYRSATSVEARAEARWGHEEKGTIWRLYLKGYNYKNRGQGQSGMDEEGGHGNQMGLSSWRG